MQIELQDDGLTGDIGENGARDQRVGRERPREKFGRLRRKFSGSLPPDFCFSPMSFFTSPPSPSVQD
jgi:hypothetical protein